MKKIFTTTLLLLLVVVFSRGQSISGFEYWFDNNLSQKTHQTITPATVFHWVDSLDISSLSDGLHLLHARFHDDSLNWSGAICEHFIKTPPVSNNQNQIVAGCYWVDDNTEGKVHFAIPAGQGYRFLDSLDFSTLSEGIHKLHFQFTDLRGSLSSDLCQNFITFRPVVNSSNQITGGEYWFDNSSTDRFPLEVSGGTVAIISDSLVLSGLIPGFHTIHFRFHDAFGRWSCDIAQHFVYNGSSVETTGLMTGYRYWFDDNLSTVYEQTLPEPVEVFVLADSLELPFLTVGDHLLHYQFTDTRGHQSGVLSTTVTVQSCLPHGGRFIVGRDSVVTGENDVTYSIEPIANAESYTWLLPQGLSINSGGNSPSVTLSVSEGAASDTLSVFASNVCGNGELITKFITINSLPGAAGTITGLAAVCKGDSLVSYSVPPIPNATSYEWILPSGATGFSTTNTILVDFTSGAQSDSISVRGTSPFGQGAYSKLYIQVDSIPGSAEGITGSLVVCQGSNQSYSVDSIPGATSYQWTLPTGVTAIGTNSARTIELHFENTYAGLVSIMVAGINQCGSGTPAFASLEVVAPPEPAGLIVGNSSVCEGQTAVTYSISQIDHAETYTWSYSPSSPSVSLAASDTSVLVSFGEDAPSGVLSVTASNLCGTGQQTQLPIDVNYLPDPAIAISGNAEVCIGTTDVVYSTNTIGNATHYNWLLPLGATGASDSSSIVVSFGATAQSGEIRVKGINSCGFGSEVSLAVNVQELPSAIAELFGDTIVCQGETGVVYSASPSPGATSYNWALPLGANGTGTTNFHSVNYSANAVSGTIQVVPVNACGGGLGKTLSISVNPLPGQPGVVSGEDIVCEGISYTYTIAPVGNANTYQWSLPTGASGSSTDTVVGIVFSSGSGSAIISVAGSNSCGTGPASQKAISQIKPLPGNISAIYGPASVCKGSGELVFSVEEPANAESYEWILPSGFTGSSDSSSIIVAVSEAAATGVLSVRGINDCGMGATKHIIVEVLGSSTAPDSIVGDSLICAGEQIQLSVSGGMLGSGAQWKWYSTECGRPDRFIGTGSSLTVTPGATTTYFVRGENSCGITPCTSFTVYVNQPSVAATSIEGAGSVCSSLTTLLTVVGGTLGDGASWQWYADGCGSTPIGEGTSLLVTPNVTTTYYIRAEGLCNTTICRSRQVEVLSLSTAPGFITGEISDCMGFSSNLMVVGGILGTGAQWKWYANNTAGSAIASGSVCNVEPVDTTLYLVRGEGPCDTTSIISLQVFPPSNHPPQISFTGNPGFLDRFVNPTDGTPTDAFRFEIIYTDADGDDLSPGYPRLHLDFEGNGNYTGSRDKLFSMMEVDAADTIMTDGKTYYFTANSLAESANWHSYIDVIDTHGCSNTTTPADAPDVIRASDISIFANDIVFSNNHPDPGDLITINATIHNYSGRVAQNFVVKLLNEFDSLAVYPEIVVSNLNAHSTTTVSWSVLTPLIPAWCPMQVLVDYTNVLNEPNELDNQAIRPFLNGDYTLPGEIVVTAATNPAVVTQSSYVQVGGRAWYSGTEVQLQDSACSGATVTCTVVETGQTGGGFTNSGGSYNVSFPAPNTEGLYHVNVTITDFSLTGEANTSFQRIIIVPPGGGIVYQPDLSVSLSIGPAMLSPGVCHWNSCRNILVNNSMGGSATISNYGNQASEPTILFIDSPDGTPDISGEYPIPSISPGDSYVVPIPPLLYSQVGSSYISAAVDYYNNNVESNEQNNYNSVCIMVHPGADIAATGGNGGTFYECQYNSITVYLDNPGGVATGAFSNRLHIYKEGVLIETLTNTVSNIPALTCTTTSFSWPGIHPVGMYEFLFEADYSGTVTELLEGNNSVTFSVNLLQCQPDLSVGSCNISVDPSDPSAFSSLTIKALVTNSGLASCSNFTVGFNLDGTVYPYQFSGTLPSGSSQQITLQAPAPEHGSNQLLVIADMNDVISETNEGNNLAAVNLCWDFAPVTPCSTPFWNYQPIRNQPVIFYTGLHNYGVYKTSAMKVKFEVNGPGLTGWVHAGTVFSTSYPTSCHCPQVVTNSVPFAFPQAGVYSVKISADPDDNFVECNESNNVLIVSITVVEYPDFRVLSHYIAPSKLNPELGETIDIDFTYENIGMDHLDSLTLKAVANNDELASFRVVGLLSGYFKTARVPSQWSSELRGLHVLKSVIDPANEVTECNESNNVATRSIIVGKAPNLLLTDLTASDTIPAINTNVMLYASVENNGFEVCNSKVNFYFRNQLNEEVLIGHQPVSLDSSQTVLVGMPWTVTSSPASIVVKITDSDPPEFDLDDNEDEFSIGSSLRITTGSLAASCYSFTDGRAWAKVQGGTAPYSYLWSNGADSDSIIGAAGQYTVSVSDATGLNVTASVTITEPPQVVAAVNVVSMQDTICQGQPAVFTASAVNGGSRPTFEWLVNGVLFATDTCVFELIPTESILVSCRMTSQLSCAENNPANSNLEYVEVESPVGVSTGIIGPDLVCQGQSTIQYSTDSISNARYYQWVLGTGLSGYSSTRFILVNVANNSPDAMISVRAGNYCGLGLEHVKSLSVDELPYQPDSVWGPKDVLPGQSGLLYVVSQVPNATSYHWTLPTGMSITENRGDSVIVKADSGIASGLVVARGVNNCGEGSGQSLFIQSPKQLAVSVLLEGFLKQNSGVMRKTRNQSGFQFEDGFVDSLTLLVLHPESPNFQLYKSTLFIDTLGAIQPIPVSGADTGSYYLVVKHRNHIEVWSAEPVSFKQSHVEFNFASSLTQVFGNNQVNCGGYWAIPSGDANKDGRVDALDLILIDNAEAIQATGYIPADLNGDGLVNDVDIEIAAKNATNFLMKKIP